MSREETFGLERIRLSDTGIPISTIILRLQSIPERYSEMRYMNQNQNQNQNQFYFRVDVKTLKQLWPCENQNQNQNQNQFYIRADVKTLKQLWARIRIRIRIRISFISVQTLKTLKQLWATIGDREVAKPSNPALDLFRACTLNGIPLCNT